MKTRNLTLFPATHRSFKNNTCRTSAPKSTRRTRGHQPLAGMTLALLLAAPAAYAQLPAKSTVITAKTGGSLTLDGATLSIPPGALSQDAQITLSEQQERKIDTRSLMVPVSIPFTVDFGKAKLLQPATLQMTVNRKGADMAGLVFEEERPGQQETELHIHAAKAAELPNRSIAAQGRVGRPATYLVAYVSASDPIQYKPLQVPFYWQAGYGWCGPSATAMTINYFAPFTGVPDRVSNFGLAGASHEDRAEGRWPVQHLRDIGVPPTLYENLKWDADLIPSNPFTRYVKGYVRGSTIRGGVYGGLDVSIEPRPVQTSCDRNVHAFVLTGADDINLWANDSNARRSSSLTNWIEFRDGNLLRDSVTEMDTVVLFATPRPEAERRGSIELAPGDNREDINRTLVFRNRAGLPISRWMWDGDPYRNGYCYSDLTGRLVDCADFGKILPRSAALTASFDVVNITDTAHTYVATGTLSSTGVMQSRSVTIPAYGRYTLSFSYDHLAGPEIGTRCITSVLSLRLTTDGVVQDTKTLSLSVAYNPAFD